MCDNDRKDFFGNIAGALTNIRQRSVMNPFLWMMGILGTVFIFSFSIPNVPEWIMISSGIGFGIVILAGLFIGIYFALTAPHNLRSDEYQTRYDMLMYMERSQSKPERIIETNVTSNPELKEKQ